MTAMTAVAHWLIKYCKHKGFPIWLEIKKGIPLVGTANTSFRVKNKLAKRFFTNGELEYNLEGVTPSCSMKLRSLIPCVTMGWDIDRVRYLFMC